MSNNYKKPQKWQTLKVVDELSLLIFNYKKLVRKHPDWDKEGLFTVLESNDWVNVIPITRSGKVILIEQYRHGTDNIVLEIPGGLIELGEIPGNAAQRECEEETGYSSDEPLEFLGSVWPNPAFQTNTCYTFLWEGCELRSEQDLDQHEDISVAEYDIEDLKKMIRTGKIRHGVVLNALMFFLSRKTI